METPVTVGTEDVQVAAKPRRRTYTAEYKRRILKEADACTTPGAVGAGVRGAGGGASPPARWGGGGGVAPRVGVGGRGGGGGGSAAHPPSRRGRKPTPVDPRDRKITEL